MAERTGCCGGGHHHHEEAGEGHHHHHEEAGGAGGSTCHCAGEEALSQNLLVMKLLMSCEAGDVAVLASVLPNLNPDAVNIDVCRPDGWNPLNLAVRSCRPEAVSLLLAAGADPNLPVGPAAVKEGAAGFTPLHVAAQMGQPAITKVLLDAGANPDAAVRADGTTPLYIAAQEGHAAVGELLLAAGAKPDLATSEDGTTPLYIACQIGNIDVVKLLLRHGADWGKARRLESAVSPMFVACQEGHDDVVAELLAAGAPVDGQCLFVAAGQGNTEVVRRLLASGADPNYARPADGASPLVIACQHSDRSYGDFAGTVRELLAGKADPNAAMAKEAGAFTPLFTAAYAGNAEVVKLLLEAGASPMTPCTGDRVIPLLVALQQLHFPVIAALVAKEKEAQLNEVTAKGFDLLSDPRLMAIFSQ